MWMSVRGTMVGSDGDNQKAVHEAVMKRRLSVQRNTKQNDDLRVIYVILYDVSGGTNITRKSIPKQDTKSDVM